MLRPPPPDLSPERLFRLLLPLRPSSALQYRIRCALSVPLLARAPSGAEEWAALDAAAEAPPEVRGSIAQLEVLARCLYTPTGPAFSSAEEVGRLEEGDVAELAGEVASALDRIAPSYTRSDYQIWAEALEKGARHWSNVGTTVAMASCVDLGMGGRVPRPDRYWGVPVCQLLDGHWMIFRAAQRAAESLKHT